MAAKNGNEKSDKPAKNYTLEAGHGQYILSGQPATLAVTAYEATASVSASVTEADLIKGLEPAFSTMAKDQLYVVAHDDQPVAPRIGNAGDGVPETTLKALANFHWAQRQWKRSEFWLNVRWAVSLIVIIAIAIVGWKYFRPGG